MTPEQITTRLAMDLPRWRYADGMIRRTYRTSGWPATLLVVNAIGHLAETAWHHPDLHVGYDRVEICLSTHSKGAVTDKDLDLAMRIEALVLWQPASDPGARPAYVRGDA